MVLVASCNENNTPSRDGLCSLLGPCLGPITIPQFTYDIVGWPASQVTNFVGSMNVGDTIHLYFVRQNWPNPCDGPADTIRTGGRWVVTGSYGQQLTADVADIAQLPDGSAVLSAKSVGGFGIWYERDAPSAQPLGVWQDVTICPGDAQVLDLRVK